MMGQAVICNAMENPFDDLAISKTDGKVLPFWVKKKKFHLYEIFQKLLIINGLENYEQSN
jgi:hypothetical protein